MGGVIISQPQQPLFWVGSYGFYQTSYADLDYMDIIISYDLDGVQNSCREGRSDGI